jgi:hypothetical protein
MTSPVNVPPHLSVTTSEVSSGNAKYYPTHTMSPPQQSKQKRLIFQTMSCYCGGTYLPFKNGYLRTEPVSLYLYPSGENFSVLLEEQMLHLVNRKLPNLNVLDRFKNNIHYAHFIY